MEMENKRRMGERERASVKEKKTRKQQTSPSQPLEIREKEVWCWNEINTKINNNFIASCSVCWWTYLPYDRKPKLEEAD